MQQHSVIFKNERTHISFIIKASFINQGEAGNIFILSQYYECTYLSLEWADFDF